MNLTSAKRFLRLDAGKHLPDFLRRWRKLHVFSISPRYQPPVRTHEAFRMLPRIINDAHNRPRRGANEVDRAKYNLRSATSISLPYMMRLPTALPYAALGRGTGCKENWTKSIQLPRRTPQGYSADKQKLPSSRAAKNQLCQGQQHWLHWSSKINPAQQPNSRKSPCWHKEHRIKPVTLQKTQLPNDRWWKESHHRPQNWPYFLVFLTLIMHTRS